MSMLRIIRVAAVASIAALVTAGTLFSLLRPWATPQAENVPIGGPFELVDQDETNVTDRTFAGKAKQGQKREPLQRSNFWLLPAIDYFVCNGEQGRRRG
jgi:hypothetical protein